MDWLALLLCSSNRGCVGTQSEIDIPSMVSSSTNSEKIRVESSHVCHCDFCEISEIFPGNHFVHVDEKDHDFIIYFASVQVEYNLLSATSVRCHDGDTPLHIALRRNLLKREDNQIPRYILPDYDGWTDDRWRVEFSTEYITDYEGEEAWEIYQYIEEERLAVINTLLASTNIDVNIQNIEFRSPIHTLGYSDCNADVIICKLLELGADGFARNNKGQTALHLACKSGASAIACSFLDRGFCIKTTDLQGLNALHYAVCANQYDTVKMILNRDKKLARSLCCEVDARGRSLMHHYLEVRNGSIEMITVLLNHGARLNDVDQDGNTPLSLHLQGFKRADQTKTCHFL